MPTESDAHYFDEDPRVPSDPILVDVSLPDVAFVMETDTGVFSRGRLDTGTGLLLRTPLALPSKGNLLDLGCGSGPIALAMARRSPDAIIWAVDVNERARELVRRNAERNGVTNVIVCAPDEIDVTMRFDAIWSNPPIRIGKEALHRLLELWLSRLADDGRATLVVQKHLGADSLQRWLTDRGFPAVRVTSRAGYRVMVVGSDSRG